MIDEIIHKILPFVATDGMLLTLVAVLLVMQLLDVEELEDEPPVVTDCGVSTFMLLFAA